MQLDAHTLLSRLNLFGYEVSEAHLPFYTHCRTAAAGLDAFKTTLTVSLPIDKLEGSPPSGLVSLPEVEVPDCAPSP